MSKTHVWIPNGTLTADAAEVCRQLLGPDIIQLFSNDHGVLGLHTHNGIWCFIQMKTASAGSVFHRPESKPTVKHTEEKFARLFELYDIIKKLYSVVESFQ